MHIYIYRKSCDLVWRSHQGCVCGGSKEISQEVAVNPLAPNLGAPPPLTPSVAVHIWGKGPRGDRRGEGGLVSKLGCNLRKSPGSVGSGKPSWGGKAPHLAEKGGALGCAKGRHIGR